MSWLRCEYLVIIVNYKTPEDVVDCLHSLVSEIQSMESLQQTVQVMVVDNCSNDNSMDVIGNAIDQYDWSTWASLIKAEKNGGFSYGNNVAIRSALNSSNPPKYYHLLNPDTTIESGALQSLYMFMSAHPDVGIAGSRQTTPAGDWNKTFRFPGVLSEIERGLSVGFVSRALKNYSVPVQMNSSNAVVDWVSGASMIVRREVFDDIGLMDERYFLYYEETDFCLNAKRAGWPSWHVVDSVVFHKVGASTGVQSSNPIKRIPKYVFESRNYYFCKNYGYFYALLVDTSYLFSLLVHKLLMIMLRRDTKAPPFLLRDSFFNGVLCSFFKR